MACCSYNPQCLPHMSFLRFLKAAAVANAAIMATASAKNIDETRFSPADIIKDVIILGGGASGSYAAVRLKDSGKTVVLVEQKDHLASHLCPGF